MLDAFVAWLDRVGPLVFWTCTIALIAVDTTAAAAVMTTKSRALVNRWTGAVLAANLGLIGVGVGVPTALYVTKMAVQTFAPTAAPLATEKGTALRER